MNTNDFGKVLGIPDVAVEKMELSSSDEFLIYVKSTKTGATCHCCGQHTEVQHGFDCEQRIRHLSVCGRPCFVVIKQPRYKCVKCDKQPVTTQQQSWRTKKSQNTVAFEKHILLLLVNSTIEDVCAKEVVGHGVVDGILDRHIKPEVDWKEIKHLKILGIDEVSLRKGHNDFVTLVTSRDEGGEMQIWLSRR